MTKNKNKGTVQAPKGRNEAWMRARLEHSNRNLRVPSGKRYKRPSPGRKWE